MARHKVGIKQRQPGMGKHALMRYDQGVLLKTLGALAASGDVSALLVDNSALAGGKYMKVGKLTMQWFTQFNNTDRVFYVAVYKQKEGATAEALDIEEDIRDARSEGRLVRGPWQLSTMPPGCVSGQMVQRKTIVLEDLLLDPNDDLLFGVTNGTEAFTGTNDLLMFVHKFWKVTE